MTAHTPGPWTVRPGVYDTNPETACEFPHGPEVIDANGETVAYCQLHGENAARLIAAAPELLEALKNFLAWLKSPPINGHNIADYREAAELALAKAKGRP